jgi:ribosomal protein S18 acetylase RimI-like enzyme
VTVAPAEALGSVTIRRAASADAAAIADVYLETFHRTYDFPLAHSDDEVRGWIAEDVVQRPDTWVAEAAAGGAQAEVVAMLALDGAGIDQLYVRPAWQGRGIGSRLVELAKELRPAGIRLYTFRVNERARRFYERHGFVVDLLGDGTANEEGQADVRYRWRP